MLEADRRWWVAVGFTVGLFGLIAFAISAGERPILGAVILVTILVAIALFYRVFPRRHYFAIALTNFLAVYACIFTFFVEANFSAVHGVAIYIGYALPIYAFLLGAWWRRHEINRLISVERLHDSRHMGRILGWLVPVFSVGALSFVWPGLALSEIAYDAVFLGSMAAIAAIVLLVSRTICLFLLDATLLFEAFFGRMADLVVPAFAFFTFYSLIVIIFACIYRILDLYGGATHFLINGQAQEISFAESLYFSIVTLSTVGYGEITPVSSLVRVIVAAQIMCGVLLLLFGFNEILTYNRDRDRSGPGGMP